MRVNCIYFCLIIKNINNDFVCFFALWVYFIKNFRTNATFFLNWKEENLPFEISSLFIPHYIVSMLFFEFLK